jgi:hypothetical protein
MALWASCQSQSGNPAHLEPGAVHCHRDRKYTPAAIHRRHGCLCRTALKVLDANVCADRGADEGGLPGLVGGAARGVLGALVRPLAAVLETSMRVADSIRSAVMGIPPLLPRSRPPRYVAADEPLAPYNWSEVGDSLPALCYLTHSHHTSAAFHSVLIPFMNSVLRSL